MSDAPFLVKIGDVVRCSSCGKRLRFDIAPDPRVVVIGIPFAWICPTCGYIVCSTCSVSKFGSEKPSLPTCLSCKNTVSPNFFLANSLPGEAIEKNLEPYIGELENTFREYGSFLGSSEEESRAIGEKINERYGLDGMNYVCDKIRDKIGSKAARLLEMAWDGIGGWMG